MISEDNDKNTEHFTNSTIKEAHWWDWLSRILPMVVLCTIAVFHYFQMYHIRDTILDAAVILFFTLNTIWWYWAVKKIVVTVKHLRSTQTKFLDILQELKKLRKEKNDLDSNR
jgi:magnesium-transporting ATPase (P-type)